VKESRKKQREVEEKRLAAERAAEEARRKAEEVAYSSQDFVVFELCYVRILNICE